jgi:hypothetical protein
MAAPDITVANFLIDYPEFQPLHDEDGGAVFLAAVLARADRHISPSWPEETRADAVFLQCADNCAQSPMGRNAKLSEKGDAETSYAKELRCRKTAFAAGRSRVV